MQLPFHDFLKQKGILQKSYPTNSRPPVYLFQSAILKIAPPSSHSPPFFSSSSFFLLSPSLLNPFPLSSSINPYTTMFRSSAISLLRKTIQNQRSTFNHLRPLCTTESSSSSSSPPPSQPGNNGGGASNSGGGGNGGEEEAISFAEAKRLMRLVNIEALKRKLGMEGEEVIGYSDLLKACESMGVARSNEEAIAFAKVLDEAGVILLFRDKAYLHPDKVVDLVRKAVPLALSPEDDPRKDELITLQKKKEELDSLAHKQVRRILWAGLGFSITQVGLFFRLTFWEFSWDVMEPIAFFATTTGLVVGYAYFLFTSRDPTYQDFMKRLFLSRQKKLFKQQNFDIERFIELQKCCKSPLDAASATRGRIGAEIGLGLDYHHHHH